MGDSAKDYWWTIAQIQEDWVQDPTSSKRCHPGHGRVSCQNRSSWYIRYQTALYVQNVQGLFSPNLFEIEFGL